MIWCVSGKEGKTLYAVCPCLVRLGRVSKNDCSSIPAARRVRSFARPLKL